MKEDSQLVCPISFEDPENVSLEIKNEITTNRLPLRDVTWKNPLSSSYITINKLPLKFLPSNSNLFNDNEHPFRWFLAPYAQLYIFSPSTFDEYKSKTKQTIKQWVEYNSGIKRAYWILIYAPKGNVPIDIQNKIYSKLSSDFYVDKPGDRSVILPLGNMDPNNSRYHVRSAAYNDLLCKIRDGTILSFQQRIAMYDAEIRRLDSFRGTPHLEFRQLFLVKESLALMYQMMQLPSEALLQYEELEALLTYVSNGMLPKSEWPWAYTPHVDKSKKDVETLTGWVACSRNGDDTLSYSMNSTRTKLLKNLVSSWELHRYIFARQVFLLLQLNRPFHCFEKGFNFILAMRYNIEHKLAEEPYESVTNQRNLSVYRETIPPSPDRSDRSFQVDIQLQQLKSKQADLWAITAAIKITRTFLDSWIRYYLEKNSESAGKNAPPPMSPIPNKKHTLNQLISENNIDDMCLNSIHFMIELLRYAYNKLMILYHDRELGNEITPAAPGTAAGPAGGRNTQESCFRNEAIELANMVTSWDKYDESGKKISTHAVNRERTSSSSAAEEDSNKDKRNCHTIEELLSTISKRLRGLALNNQNKLNLKSPMVAKSFNSLLNSPVDTSIGRNSYESYSISEFMEEYNTHSSAETPATAAAAVAAAENYENYLVAIELGYVMSEIHSLCHRVRIASFEKVCYGDMLYVKFHNMPRALESYCYALQLLNCKSRCNTSSVADYLTPIRWDYDHNDLTKLVTATLYQTRDSLTCYQSPYAGYNPHNLMATLQQLQRSGSMSGSGNGNSQQSYEWIELKYWLLRKMLTCTRVLQDRISFLTIGVELMRNTYRDFLLWKYTDTSYYYLNYGEFCSGFVCDLQQFTKSAASKWTQDFTISYKEFSRDDDEEEETVVGEGERREGMSDSPTEDDAFLMTSSFLNERNSSSAISHVLTVPLEQYFGVTVEYYEKECQSSCMNDVIDRKDYLPVTTEKYILSQEDGSEEDQQDTVQANIATYVLRNPFDHKGTSSSSSATQQEQEEEQEKESNVNLMTKVNIVSSLPYPVEVDDIFLNYHLVSPIFTDPSTRQIKKLSLSCDDVFTCSFQQQQASRFSAASPKNIASLQSQVSSFFFPSAVPASIQTAANTATVNTATANTASLSMDIPHLSGEATATVTQLSPKNPSSGNRSLPGSPRAKGSNGVEPLKQSKIFNPLDDLLAVKASVDELEREYDDPLLAGLLSSKSKTRDETDNRLPPLAPQSPLTKTHPTPPATATPTATSTAAASREDIASDDDSFPPAVSPAAASRPEKILIKPGKQSFHMKLYPQKTGDYTLVEIIIVMGNLQYAHRVSHTSDSAEPVSTTEDTAITVLFSDVKTIFETKNSLFQKTANEMNGDVAIHDTILRITPYDMSPTAVAAATGEGEREKKEAPSQAALFPCNISVPEYIAWNQEDHILVKLATSGYDKLTNIKFDFHAEFEDEESSSGTATAVIATNSGKAPSPPPSTVVRSLFDPITIESPKEADDSSEVSPPSLAATDTLDIQPISQWKLISQNSSYSLAPVSAILACLTENNLIHVEVPFKIISPEVQGRNLFQTTVLRQPKRVTITCQLTATLFRNMCKIPISVSLPYAAKVTVEPPKALPTALVVNPRHSMLCNVLELHSYPISCEIEQKYLYITQQYLVQNIANMPVRLMGYQMDNMEDAVEIYDTSLWQDGELVELSSYFGKEKSQDHSEQGIVLGQNQKFYYSIKFKIALSFYLLQEGQPVVCNITWCYQRDIPAIGTIKQTIHAFRHVSPLLDQDHFNYVNNHDSLLLHLITANLHTTVAPSSLRVEGSMWYRQYEVLHVKYRLECQFPKEFIGQYDRMFHITVFPHSKFSSTTMCNTKSDSIAATAWTVGQHQHRYQFPIYNESDKVSLTLEYDYVLIEVGNLILPPLQIEYWCGNYYQTTELTRIVKILAPIHPEITVIPANCCFSNDETEVPLIQDAVTRVALIE